MLDQFYVHAADGHRLALTRVRLATQVPEEGAPTFLLLHGFAQNRLAYTLGELPGALLRRGANVLIGELRGHGESREERTTTGLDAMLRFDLPALVKRAAELGAVERVHLMGHSMGGMLGYGLLARSHRLASLTTFGAALVLGTGRPMIRAAATLVAPLLHGLGPERMPIDLLLRTVGPLARRPERRGPRGLLRNAIRLANPSEADPAHLDEILANAHEVPTALLADLAAIARTGRAVIDGVDLVRAVEASALPIAAVVGRRDIFAGRKAVAPLERGPGPRRILVLDLAGHIDVTMGRHSERVVEELWPFLVRS